MRCTPIGDLKPRGIDEGPQSGDKVCLEKKVHVHGHTNILKAHWNISKPDSLCVQAWNSFL